MSGGEAGATRAEASGTWRLGDRTVARMGFGSMRLTVDPDTDRAVRVLRRAVELGVTHIDTMAAYFTPGGIISEGEGHVRYATELIRRALAPYPDDLVIATKVGPGVDEHGRFEQAATPAALRRQVEENLRRLGRDHLDLVNLRIIRKPGQDSIAERFGALADLRREGLIRHLGISNVRVDHLDEAQVIAPVVCVQNAYGIDINRDQDDFVALCGQRGVAFVPFFAIAGQQRESGATTRHHRVVVETADRHHVTPHQVRLAWTLQQGAHVLAIPGTGNIEHLEANLAAGALRLTPDELDDLGRQR